MNVVINIAGEPTSWWTRVIESASSLATDLALGPVSVDVFFPVIGTLLISPAANVAIFDVPPTVSWIPSDAQAPVATLYIQAGPAQNFTGYALPIGTNIADLASQIKTAMTDYSTMTVQVSSLVGSGVAVLNGATLASAVVCPPPPPKNP